MQPKHQKLLLNCTSYESPFSGRYASKEMREIFSPNRRYGTFRALWIELAKAQKKLGLSITDEQIREMQKHAHSIDFKKVSSYEKTFRHDVMAHIHAFGDVCPKAKPIIHLGATSCFVTDNADLILMKEALFHLQKNLVGIVRKLSAFAKKYEDLACLGFTHFQPAQPTTVGKRGALWLQDFLLDLKQCERLIGEVPFLGSKGATGTQNSFLLLFRGNHEKVKKLDHLVADAFGFTKVLTITGQTYPRKWDLLIFQFLESFAASCHKFAGDIRLLAHMGEITEESRKGQVGSSAMPHKSNPIYSERICGLARLLLSFAQNPAYTASLQWLERSLDDSSNRRIILPEAFLCADALMLLLAHLIDGVSVHPKKIQENLDKELPHLLTENLLMHAALEGIDRLKAHEILRQEVKKGKISEEACLKKLGI